MKKSSILLAMALIFCLSGCATIILGSRQSVGISSTPSNARIFINDENVGETPKSIEIKKNDAKSFKVKLELDGYLPYETVLTRKNSGWIAGNIVLGGFIGLAVDFATGGAYVLTPEQIQAELGKTTALISNENDTIKFIVTLQPKEDWIKIGQLEQAVDGLK